MAVFCLLSSAVFATGVLPETSVVEVEEQNGEGVINLQNTDDHPVLLLTTLKNVSEDAKDTGSLLLVTPPVARIEARKTQRVRFILTDNVPLKTECLKRVIFEGVPPQQKNKNIVCMTIRQNLPVIIRPAGLTRDESPWKRLIWYLKEDVLTLNNPSPYVVRLGQSVTSLPDQTHWILPHAYMLPRQTLTLIHQGKKTPSGMSRVRLSPATTWGFTVGNYETALTPYSIFEPNNTVAMATGRQDADFFGYR